MAIRSLVGFLFEGAGEKDFAISDPENKIASFEVHAVLTETHTFNNQVTDNPVENGSPVGDNSIEQPVKLEIQAMVSDAPILGLLENVSNAVDNLLGGSKYTSDCFGALFELFKYRGYLTVYTQYKTYSNMMIENITIPRDPKDGEALIFNIQMKQVRLVETATTNLPPGVGMKKDGKSNATGDAANRATPNKDVGKNTGVEVKPDDGASMLKTAKDAGASAIGDIIKNVKGQLAGLGL